MTEDRKRREQLTEYVATVRKFHPLDELRRRFSHGTFDETFEAIGMQADPMLKDKTKAIWLGMEVATESRFLDREYLDQEMLTLILDR